jgi:hypothetical protein
MPTMNPAARRFCTWSGPVFVVAFYIPMAGFFIWLIAVNTFMFRDLYRQPVREPAMVRAPVVLPGSTT